MGRQSSRILIDGQDAKQVIACDEAGTVYDIDQIWMSDKASVLSLAWEKLLSNKWRLVETNIELFASVDMKFGNGVFLAIGTDSENRKLLIRTTADGINWTEYSYDTPFSNGNIRLHFVNRTFFIVGYNGIVTTQDGSGISSLIDVFSFHTLTYEETLNATVLGARTPQDLFISDGNYIYTILEKSEVPLPPGEYITARYGGFVYRSNDGINWNCINASLNSYTYSGSTFKYLVGNYYPNDYTFSTFGMLDGKMYGEIRVANYSSSIYYPESYDTVHGVTDFESVTSLLSDCEYFYAYRNAVAMAYISDSIMHSLDFVNWTSNILEYYGIPYDAAFAQRNLLRDEYIVLACDAESDLLLVLFDKQYNLIDYEYFEDERAFENGFIAYGNGIFLIDNYGTHEKKSVFIRTEV